MILIEPHHDRRIENKYENVNATICIFLYYIHSISTLSSVHAPSCVGYFLF